MPARVDMLTTPVWAALPCLPGSRSVVVAGADDVLRSYAQDTSQESWETSLGDEALQLFQQDSFVVASQRHSLSVLDSRSGELLWSLPQSTNVVSTAKTTLVTQDKEQVVGWDLSSGHTVWQASQDGSSVAWTNTVLTVKEQRDGVQSLQAREASTGQMKWSTEDGLIDYLTPTKIGVFYSSTKTGRHKEPITRVSFRDRQGTGRWSYRCAGPLRQKPITSLDGKRAAVVETDEIDKSRSRVTVLDTETGRPLYSVGAEYSVEPVFLEDGKLYLGETEFSRVPGEEKHTHRVIAEDGKALWEREGKPAWVYGGEQLVVAWPNRVSALDSSSGLPVWTHPVAAATAPLACSKEALTLVEGGCRLRTLRLSDGADLLDVDSGHKLLTERVVDGYLTDHEGHVWKENVPTGQENFAGAWERSKPFQIPFLSGPAQRGGEEAVFVDWDGDQQDLGGDPVLVDSQQKLVSWAELQSRDTDGDYRLENGVLSDYRLWFDSDSDGKVSSEGELSDIIGGSFDKGRMELDQHRLWLASDSRCPGGHTSPGS